VIAVRVSHTISISRAVINYKIDLINYQKWELHAQSHKIQHGPTTTTRRTSGLATSSQILEALMSMLRLGKELRDELKMLPNRNNSNKMNKMRKERENMRKREDSKNWKDKRLRNADKKKIRREQLMYIQLYHSSYSPIMLF
jgi:hypothetical protein